MDVKDLSVFEALLKDLKKASTDPSSGPLGPFRKLDILYYSSQPDLTWADVVGNLARPEDVGKRDNIVALRSCLENPKIRFMYEAGSSEDEYDNEDHEKYTEKSREVKAWIASFVATSMAPVVEICSLAGRKLSVEKDEDEDSGEDEDHAMARCANLSSPGIAVLQILSQSQTPPMPFEPQVLYTLMALAEPPHPDITALTSQANTAAASKLLETSAASLSNKQDFIINDILQSYLRPLFSRARPAAITESGRPNEYSSNVTDREARGFGLEMESKAYKPWKYEDLRALPVLRWAVAQADNETLTKHLTLFTPPLLTLLDDPTTKFREQGLLIMQDFLRKVQLSRLRDTGLTRVFEDAIFPTLMFLPSLTPEAESVRLLEAAYPVLLLLAGTEEAANQGGKEAVTTRNKQLDRVLREGIFSAYHHSGENVRIAEVLARKTADVVLAMGLGAVKHLKDLIPMINSVLADPFAMTHPATLNAMITALSATVRSCWPRIVAPEWLGDVIMMLTTCWLTVIEHAAPKTDPVKLPEAVNLRRVAQELAAAMRRFDVGMVETKFNPLIEREPLLKELFALALIAPENSNLPDT